MSQTESSHSEAERDEEELANEEAEAAADEAGKIGGPGPDYDEVPPEDRPLAEGGEGEAEGFELAEQELADIASHGDQHRFPGRHAGAPEEPTDTAFGEPDQPIPDDE